MLLGITLPDYRDTHDLLSVVDVVISPLSTILLEAALHAKPVVVYAPRGPEGSTVLATNLPMLHFADFLAIEQVAFADRIEALVELLPRLVDPLNGPAIGEKLAVAAARFVTPFERPWRERLVDFLHGTVDLADRRRVGAAAE